MYGQIVTGRDLYDRLQNFLGTDSDLTEATVAGWLDQAISEFPKQAFPTLREPYTDVSANLEYDLPLDFTTVEGYSTYDSTTGAYTKYIKASEVVIGMNDMITFPEDLDNIYVEYNQCQSPYTSLDVELPLRKSIRPILYYYIVAEYYNKEGEGSVEEERIANKYYQKFEAQKAIRLSELENRNIDGPVETVDEMYKKSRSHFSSTAQNFNEYDGNNDVD